MKPQTKNLVEALVIGILVLAGSAEAQLDRPLLERLKVLPASFETASAETGSMQPIQTPDVGPEGEAAFRDEVKSNLSGVYRCAEQRRSTGAGRVLLAFTVLPSGEFSRLRVAVRFSESESQVVNCIRDALLRSQIQTHRDQETQFRFSFAFAGASQILF